MNDFGPKIISAGVTYIFCKIPTGSHFMFSRCFEIGAAGDARQSRLDVFISHLSVDRAKVLSVIAMMLFTGFKGLFADIELGDIKALHGILKTGLADHSAGPQRHDLVHKAVRIHGAAHQADSYRALLSGAVPYR